MHCSMVTLRRHVQHQHHNLSMDTLMDSCKFDALTVWDIYTVGRIIRIISILPCVRVFMAGGRCVFNRSFES
jgi:hypothetical protein